MIDKPVQTFIGSISGTSVDGLDLAAVFIDADGAISSIGPACTEPFPSALRDALLALGQPLETDLDRFGAVDRSLGEFIGLAINKFITAHRLDPTAIGSHGQTVRHRPPPGPDAFTLQIGDPNQIAEITGCTTVADFRRRDMAAGGQGAPLVPPFHQALFSQPPARSVVLNIGGISNVSILDSPPRGFDTGPGNCLMDSWCAKHIDTPFDVDGAWAASGKLDQDLLSRLMACDYFQLAPPKSTGREYFNLQWLDQFAPEKLAPADVQATLVELTARCTADALARWGGGFDEIIVCGGGRLNGFLLDRLAANISTPVHTSEAKNVDGDAIEAAAFAWLAYRTLAGLPGNEPAVTGAKGPRLLGAIYPGTTRPPVV